MTHDARVWADVRIVVRAGHQLGLMQFHIFGFVEDLDVELVPIDEILQQLSVYLSAVHLFDISEPNGILNQLE
jgi:hypothetical protein